MEENKKEKGGRPSGRTPLKVLSTSLGLAIAAHMLLAPGLFTEQAHAEGTEPKLTEWSTEEVKAYFNPSLDWSLPLTDAGTPQPTPTTGTGTASGTGTGTSGGTAPVIIHQGGGFGWDDLLLYHLLFNNGGSYSSGSWHKSHPVYDPRTKQPYQPKTYSTGAFENKPVTGSNVKPKTSASSGSFTTKQGASSSKTTTSSGKSTTSSGTTSSGTTSSGSKSGTTSSGSTSSGSTSSGTTSSGTTSSGSSSSKSGTSSSSSSSSSSGKSTSSSSGSIGGKSGGFSSGGSSSSGS
ncbi:hypothetical protein [Gorillibacterium sp. sgz5001074]|uniref:hypothetical protein n=1 Tax=Gorillibacterium sp. sgz5001074 TaxID=3446695 RepID=UPI003F66E132